MIEVTATAMAREEGVWSPHGIRLVRRDIARRPSVTAEPGLAPGLVGGDGVEDGMSPARWVLHG